MSLRNKAISAAKWSVVALVFRRGAGVVTTAILAKLLLPSDFGVLAMAAVVSGFLELFRDLGTGAAIIQKKVLSEALLSSVFWFNAAFGLALSVLLFIAAPLVGSFYREPAVVPILRVLAIGPFISSLAVVHGGLLARDLRFRGQTKVEIIGLLISSPIAIFAAYSGFGAWSLVIQVLLNTTIGTIGVCALARWLPRSRFEMAEVRSVLSYSLNLTAFSVSNFFARNADNVLIGRYLGSQNLGYYDLAYRLMLYPLQTLSWTVHRVMFPVYAQLQDDHERMRKIYLQTVSAIALLTFPMMLGLAFVAVPFVQALFGENWAPVAELMWILCPLGALQSILTTIGPLYQARGRTDLLFRVGLVNSIVIVTAIVIGLRWGIVGVALSYALAVALLTYPTLAIPYSLVGLRVRDLVVKLRPTCICVLAMLAVLALLEFFLHSFSAWPKLLISTALGALSYGAFTWLLNKQNVQELVDLARTRGTLR